VRNQLAHHLGWAEAMRGVSRKQLPHAEREQFSRAQRQGAGKRGLSFFMTTSQPGAEKESTSFLKKRSKRLL
jgi:hypothetical protein